MATVRSAVVLAVLGVVSGSSSAEQLQTTSVAPLQKVIQMLTDMSAASKKEKEQEEITFAAFNTWCTEESSSLKKQIAREAEEEELLDAEIGQLGSEAKALAEAIAKLESEVATYEAKKESETKQRAKDNEDFLAESKDYEESIDALGRAIDMLDKQSYDRTGAEALLQLSSSDRLPSKAKSILTAFVGMMGDGETAGYDGSSYEAPQANAYEFQSSGVVEMLKRLKDEFRTKLAESQKAEMNSRHAFEVMAQDLTDAIATSKKDSEEKAMEKERKIEAAAMNKKKLATTTADKEAHEKTLSEMEAECTEKRLSYEEKQKLRAEELEALAKATEILSSPELQGRAEKYLALSQGKAGATALLQQKSQVSKGVRRRVRDLLADSGRRLHSQRLALLAEKLTADPFAKVRGMIDAMITRLLEEANADADHEGFCDAELGKSKITREKLSSQISELSAAVEEGKATIMKLGEDLKFLAEEIASLEKMVKEATELRVAEKAENTATVKDAQEAQSAVAAATAVLKDFYATALTATAFVQLGAVQAPEVKMGSEEWTSLANPDFEGTVDKGHKAGMQTYGDTYAGLQDKEGGVLALLGVIQSDFATLEADTNAGEEVSKKAYEELMTQSKRDIATKRKSVEMNTADKAAAESKMQSDVTDLKATQDQLLAADRYHEELVPQCIDQGQTFEERTKSREAEIASLKEALAILNSEDIETSA
eukprot:CAMPEP_0170575352 /NCGR_PEP_ID=MMETSP0224-20130122/3817_1 /TAXON_ID=285029 /ORGANISM="Togula jolla, Strain CCCM 725" /LENGTH=713 /DNA_ID=CAMNT_0010898129 /DNA_START=63 /DNA_END=2204 /DNA_ORIENTATION=-